jgi:hypothetical protein
MWAITKEENKLRHMWGGKGDKNAEVLHTLCSIEGKPPLDYLQIHIEKCGKCEALLGKKGKKS